MSMPPGLPPDPNAPPTAPMTPLPPTPPFSSAPPPPPAPAAPPQPAGGYAVPPQYMPAMAGGSVDPLVLPAGSSFGAWFAKVQEVAKRSWKSALIICTLGIAVPSAAVSLVSWLGGWGAGWSVTSVGSLSAAIGSLFLGLLITLVASIAACYVAAAGWAAGTWALVREASGQPAGLGPAFSYGFKRAMALFPWTVLAAIAYTIGSACFFLPGVYLAFGFSLFGFVAIFERGQNPVSRSFGLTHKSDTIGPTLGKIGILFGVYLAYTLVIGLIFGAIALATAIAAGSIGSFGYNIGYGLFDAISSLLAAPVFAVLLLGLLPTYAELRAREAPLSTEQLQQELGA